MVYKSVSPLTRGNPESALRWTIKSTRVLAEELKRFGHNVSHIKVNELLNELGYSLSKGWFPQVHAKRIEGNQHVDRDAQFAYINNKIVPYFQFCIGENTVSLFHVSILFWLFSL